MTLPSASTTLPFDTRPTTLPSASLTTSASVATTRPVASVSTDSTEPNDVPSPPIASPRSFTLPITLPDASKTFPSCTLPTTFPCESRTIVDGPSTISPEPLTFTSSGRPRVFPFRSRTMPRLSTDPTTLPSPSTTLPSITLPTTAPLLSRTTVSRRTARSDNTDSSRATSVPAAFSATRLSIDPRDSPAKPTGSPSTTSPTTFPFRSRI